MDSIELLGADSDFERIAFGLSALMQRGDNRDIQYEFPDTYARYSDVQSMVAAKLEAAAEKCAPGIRRQFIAYSEEEIAVGMAAIQLVKDVPEGISESTPNISVMVCSPFRNKRFGTHLLKAALEYVDEFDGLAWTRVSNDNLPSRVLVSRAGFSPLYEDYQHTYYSLPPKI